MMEMWFGPSFGQSFALPIFVHFKIIIYKKNRAWMNKPVTTPHDGLTKTCLYLYAEPQRYPTPTYLRQIQVLEKIFGTAALTNRGSWTSDAP
jgi:hypothetical protein